MGSHEHIIMGTGIYEYNIHKLFIFWCKLKVVVLSIQAWISGSVSKLQTGTEFLSNQGSISLKVFKHLNVSLLGVFCPGGLETRDMERSWVIPPKTNWSLMSLYLVEVTSLHRVGKGEGRRVVPTVLPPNNDVITG